MWMDGAFVILKHFKIVFRPGPLWDRWGLGVSAGSTRQASVS